MWFCNSKRSRVNRRRSNNRKTRRSFIKGGEKGTFEKPLTQVPKEISALFVTEGEQKEINLYIKNLNSPKRAVASRSKTAKSILSTQSSVFTPLHI